jgi:hypothetical protein
MLFSFIDFRLPRDNSTNVHISVPIFVWYFHNTKSNVIWEGTHNNTVKKEGTNNIIYGGDSCFKFSVRLNVKLLTNETNISDLYCRSSAHLRYTPPNC